MTRTGEAAPVRPRVFTLCTPGSDLTHTWAGTDPAVTRPLSPVATRPARREPRDPVAWDDVRWALLAPVLGPLADRSPDVAIALLGAVDEAVAVGRAQWRRRR